MASRTYSIVEFSNENQGYKCGYCKSKTTNFSHGMWAHQLSVHDYQDLIDRGWRRSGHYCYKPTLWKMCCPSYTIRCDALNFKLSKSQKKIIKRMNRFLAHGERSKQHSQPGSIDGDEGSAHEPGTDMVEVQHAQTSRPASLGNSPSQNLIVSSSIISAASSVSLAEEERLTSEPKETPKTDQGTIAEASDAFTSSCGSLNKTSLKPGEGADKGRPPCKKAKVIRLERKQEKLNKLGGASLSAKTPKAKHDSSPKSLEDFLNSELPDNPAHRLQVRLVRSQPASADFNSSFKESLTLYRRYQMRVHGDPESKCTESQYRRFLVRSPLELKLVALNSRDFANTFDQSWCLYAKYQKAIHGETDDECDPTSYVDFLVASPIKALRPADGSGPPQGYGSFHQQYWLNDQLIAVGVLDILPRCVSSVYFYYDPDYSDLTLGTYGSLREVALTRTLNHSVPDLQWYCMGFYIHSCPKMRYKAGLSPSSLLCPETLTWHPIERCLSLLDKERYCRFNPDRSASDSDSIVNLNQVLVLYEQCAMDYGQYCQLKGHINEVENTAVLQYARLVGKKCARRILLLRQSANM